jgi:hypothetical protein
LRKACAISNGPRVLSNCLCPQVWLLRSLRLRSLFLILIFSDS